MQEKIGLPQLRFVNYSKAGATHRKSLRMVWIRTAWILALAVGFSWFAATTLHAQAPSPQPGDLVVQHDVPMKTRDGVTLYADIYRPNAAGKFPVILMRTPYDKTATWAVGPVFRMIPRGYVVIIQDVRGRYTSEGE